MENKQIPKTKYHALGELNTSWGLWERQQSHVYNTDQLNEIIVIDNLKQLARFWKTSKEHEYISKILQLDEDTIPRIQLNIKNEYKEMQIDCFMLFRKGIRPEWEDPKNAQGGHLLYQIQFPKRALVDALWKNLFLDLIGESWTYSERICGLRVLNKVKTKEIYFKLEIWIDFREDTHNSEHFATMDDQQKCLAELKNRFIQTINQSYTDSKGEDRIGKVADISELKFENHMAESSSPNHRGGGGGRKGPPSGGYGGGRGGGSRRY